MNETSIVYRPIGVIHSGHIAAEQTPIQPAYARGCMGQVDVLPEYAEGLRDLEGFSHIFLIYHFHRSGPAGVAGEAVSPGRGARCVRDPSSLSSQRRGIERCRVGQARR
jgi:tRNA (Thr-GGU) A37 N-methylase